MRGTSDRDKGQWPLRPADIGVNDVHLFNRLTGKGIEREAKQGDYGSPERKAQNVRLEARAAELNAQFLKERADEIQVRAKADKEARDSNPVPQVEPYSWVFDTRGEVQPHTPRELPPEPVARILPAYGVSHAKQA